MEAYATQEELNEEAEERKNNPVESNEVEGWPQGPRIGAESAILMDANTGVILYAKNIDAKMYPASTTKVMTSLVAVENCPLDEMITASSTAIDANPADGSNMGLNAGETLSLDDLLHGILITSANEGCNVVAEHIAGSMDGYVDMMNNRAAELGCTNTHFVTPNGLHDENHYTSAHDLAIIACEFFSHPELCSISSTPSYTIPASANNIEHVLTSHNKLLRGMTYEYPYIVGSKTGFTSNSRQTLCSCAEYNGMKLICVIMKEESPYQFEDTVNLFDYGFNNFSMVNIAANDSAYNYTSAPFFNSENDLFGQTAPLVTMDSNSSLILPAGVDFSMLDTTVNYNSTDENVLATVDYYYNSMYLGSANIYLNKSAGATAIKLSSRDDIVIINIFTCIKVLILAIIGIVVLLILWGFLRRIIIINRRRSNIKKRRSGSGRTRSYRPPRRPSLRQPGKNDRININSNRRDSSVRRSSTDDRNQYRREHDINFKDFEL